MTKSWIIPFIVYTRSFKGSSAAVVHERWSRNRGGSLRFFFYFLYRWVRFTLSAHLLSCKVMTWMRGTAQGFFRLWATILLNVCIVFLFVYGLMSLYCILLGYPAGNWELHCRRIWNKKDINCYSYILWWTGLIDAQLTRIRTRLTQSKLN